MPWKYEVRWWPDDNTRSGQKNRKNIIFVESKPRDSGTFGLVNVDAWINSDETDDATLTFSFMMDLEKNDKLRLKVLNGAFTCNSGCNCVFNGRFIRGN